MSSRIGSKKGLWIGGLAVVALLVFTALPGIAAVKTKSVKLEVTPSSALADTPAVHFMAKLTNNSPAGVANPNSFTVTVPSGFIVTAVAPKPLPPPASSNPNLSSLVANVDGSSTVSVKSLDPVQRLQFVTLDITVTTPLITDCIPASGEWTAVAWTGSGLTGDTFIQTLPKPTTSLTCASSIAGQVWRDHNKNGVKDTADEAGQSGWTVKAFDGTALAGTALPTGTDGKYLIEDLTSGKTYTVCEFAPAEDAGFEYRGWIQSVPSANTLCDEMAGAEPNGISVPMPDLATYTVVDQDFLNVRTITIPGTGTVTVVCSDLPPGGVFTVGDGVNEPLASVTIDPDACKPGVYVFESWTTPDGDQFVDFHPTFTTGDLVPLTESLTWVIDGERTQQTLSYDDSGAAVPNYRPMLFCVVDEFGDFAAMPAPVSPDEALHTSCLLNTTEEPTQLGVLRRDSVYTLVDGRRLMSS
jgi:hypothetical protein